MHTLWVVGKPDFQENWAASVVSANKFFHLVGSYFVPSFVSPSLVKPTSNCFYCRCIQCFNIVTWSRLDQIHMHAFFPQGPSHAILLQHNLYKKFFYMEIYTRNSFTILLPPLNNSFFFGNTLEQVFYGWWQSRRMTALYCRCMTPWSLSHYSYAASSSAAQCKILETASACPDVITHYHVAQRGCFW
jgi:hypothetical protein